MVTSVVGTELLVRVVVGWVFEVNVNDPVLPSGSDHVTVHVPFPKI